MDSGTTTAAVAASPPADAATAATSLAPPSATLLALRRSHALGFVRLPLSPFSRGLALSLSLSLSRTRSSPGLPSRALFLIHIHPFGSDSNFANIHSSSSIWMTESFHQQSFVLIPFFF
jgi:hypothetical protein